jgi:O-antigen/teichoic acid export membrane protein
VAESQNKVGEQVAAYAVGQAVSFPLNLLFDLLIARALGPALRGQWFLVIAAVTFLANLLSFSIPAYAVYRLGKQPTAAGFLNVAALTYAGVVAAVSAGAALLLPHLGVMERIGFVTPSLWAVAGGLLATELYLLCSAGFLTGLGRVRVLSRLNMATAAITVVVGAGPVVMLKPSALGALASYLVARVIAATLMAWAVGASRHPPEARSAGLVREMVRFGVAGQVGNLAVLTYQRVILFLVGAFVGTRAAGYYSVAESLSTRVVVLVGPLQVAFSGRISRGDPATAARWTAQLVRIAGLLLVSIGLPLVAFGGVLVAGLYGRDFAPAATVFRLLLPAAALTTLATLVSLFFSGHLGRPIINSVVSLTTMAISVPLSYVFILNSGTTGAAWAALISGGIVFSLIYGVFVVRNRGVRTGLLPQRGDWEVLRDTAVAALRLR